MSPALAGGFLTTVPPGKPGGAAFREADSKGCRAGGLGGGKLLGLALGKNLH